MMQRMALLLIIINFSIILAGGLLTPVWAELVHHIGGDIRTAGNAICIFSIILGFFTWIAARIENHFGHAPWILVISQGLFVLSYAGYFAVHTPIQLYMVQIALGISGAIQVPALFHLFQQMIPENKNTWYWGVWNGVYNIATGIAALIGAYVVHHFGFEGLFTCLLVISSVGLLLSLFTLSSHKT